MCSIQTGCDFMNDLEDTIHRHLSVRGNFVLVNGSQLIYISVGKYATMRMKTGVMFKRNVECDVLIRFLVAGNSNVSLIAASGEVDYEK